MLVTKGGWLAQRKVSSLGRILLPQGPVQSAWMTSPNLETGAYAPSSCNGGLTLAALNSLHLDFWVIGWRCKCRCGGLDM